MTPTRAGATIFFLTAWQVLQLQSVNNWQPGCSLSLLLYAELPAGESSVPHQSSVSFSTSLGSLVP